MKVSLTVNGELHEVDVAQNTLLVDILRVDL
ncbi:MAG: (2Fe-2S)-binding protein, partial [Gammaproteobacteria bacterium]|nr:(2Fe-2S)-binding protein [Gammaproteobacteria bacterium]